MFYLCVLLFSESQVENSLGQNYNCDIKDGKCEAISF